jgi:HAD superfamily hydrolase (TIGR01509 family)
MAQYEVVLFDFDGVVVDSEPVHFECWQEILTPFGIDLDWQTYSEHCIGITDRTMLAFLCSRSRLPLDIEVLAAEYPRKKDMFRERMMKIGIPPAIRELAQELRSDYKLGVVTSSNIREVGALLESAGLMPYLDTVVHGGDVRHHKPAPDPYLLAIERLGVKTGLAVEDSKAGIASAKAAGLDVIEIRDANQVPALVRSFLKASRRNLG